MTVQGWWKVTGRLMLQGKLGEMEGKLATMSQQLAETTEGLRLEQGVSSDLGAKADRLQKEVEELQARHQHTLPS